MNTNVLRRFCVMGEHDYENEIKRLYDVIDASQKIVFFGGAGVSTESGIPDFRSVDGLYNQKYDYPPETILSHTFFMRKTKEFFDFYKDKLLCEGVEPNKAHKALAKLEQEGKLIGVVTQNIDGLHQAAGSKKVFELHGSVLRNNCMRCRKFFDVDYIAKSEGVPMCECGGIIKPDVVLYEEGLDDDVVSGAIDAISRADTMIIAGTSLTVYPAAGMIRYFNGNNLVLINRDATQMDKNADIVIHDKVGKVLGGYYER